MPELENQGQGPQTAGNPPQAGSQGTQGGSTLVTELAGNVASQGQGAPAQEPAQASQGNQPGPVELPGWTAATTKVLRSDPRFTAYASKFKSLDDAVKSSLDLEEKIGKMVAIPDEKAPDQDKAAFWAKLGVPEKPTDYKLDIPKDMDVDETQVEEYKALAHKFRMNNDQASAVFKLAAERASKEIEAFRARNDQAKQEVEQTLKREWGDKYDEQRAILARGIQAYGSPELLKDADATGMGNKTSFIKLLHRFGQLTQEDSALKRPGGGGRSQRDPAEVLYGNSP